MLAKIKKYWLEYIFVLLLINAFLCAIGFVHEEIPISRHKLVNEDLQWEDMELDLYLERIRQIPNIFILMVGSELDDSLFSSEVIRELENMSLTQIGEAKKPITGIIAVWQNEGIRYCETCNHDSIKYGANIEQTYIFLESYDYLDNGYVYIDDALCSKGTTGLNIVVWNQAKNSIMDSVNYSYKNGKIQILR